MDDSFATGYAIGSNDANCGGGGGMGGMGALGALLIPLLLLGLLFGGFGYGGGFGGGMMGGYGMLNGMATRADINEGFALNNITSGITGIQQGICDSTYAINNSINGVQSTLMQGFHGVDNAVCSIGHQISDCCCTTQRAIDGLGYNQMMQINNLQQAMCTNTRDIIDSQNNSTRAILDFLTQDKISTLTAENQALKFAASQSQQNAYLTATIDAATAEVLRRSGHDCPSAAYIVQPPTPVSFPTNHCGAVQFGGNNCCCSCC